MIEVSTDKIDAEVPAPVAGTITKLLVNPDDVVQVGPGTGGDDRRRRRRHRPRRRTAAGDGAAAAPAPSHRR